MSSRLLFYGIQRILAAIMSFQITLCIIFKFMMSSENRESRYEKWKQIGWLEYTRQKRIKCHSGSCRKLMKHKMTLERKLRSLLYLYCKVYSYRRSILFSNYRTIPSNRKKYFFFVLLVYTLGNLSITFTII